MPTYNKLIRDKIPAIMDAEGKVYNVRVLNTDEYAEALRAKCVEEVAEYLHAETDHDAAEELADILEVVYALASLHELTKEDLETIRARKFMERGGFEKRLWLIEVKDDESHSL
jgi:predicted house-cleaning noncanonical NTP pyrophosphatase (MazG superfamily)